MARTTPVITHPLFVDDSLLFTRASILEVDCMVEVLKRYQDFSGQMVNLDKSEALLSQNVAESEKNLICNKTGIKAVEALTKYLGLPALFGISKKVVFAQVIDKVWKKVNGWKEKVLSRTGKQVLIKFVAQAIPTYVMGCFRLHKHCCKEIEALIARFWWGSSKEERRIHWMSWSKMTKAKNSGSLGFRVINVSLLGRNYWRLLTGSSSFLERVFKSRYYPRTSISDAQVGYMPRYVWRSILGERRAVELRNRWRIGNRRKFDISKDRWLPVVPIFKVVWDVRGLDQGATVSDLDSDLCCWKRELIFDCFGFVTSLQLCSIPLF